MSQSPRGSAPARLLGLPVPFVISLLLLVAGMPGCVHRRMTIRTNPPGASVFIDDQEIGTTPVSAQFVYYGTRKIQLIKDGFETLTVKHTFYPPWYQLPGLDFFSDNFAGRELRDEQALDFQLQPQQLLPEDKLLERAEQLRGNSVLGYAVSLPNGTSKPEPVAPMSPMPSTPPPGGLAPPPILPMPANNSSGILQPQ